MSKHYQCFVILLNNKSSLDSCTILVYSDFQYLYPVNFFLFSVVYLDVIGIHQVVNYLEVKRK